MRANSRRRFFIRGLLALAALVFAGGVWLIASYSWSKSRIQAQQRAAAEAVRERGGEAQLIFSRIGIYLEGWDAPSLFLLNSKNITDDDLTIFESAPTTRGLHLFGNQITDQGLIRLKDLKSLDFLDLRRNGGITDAGLIHLEGLKNLKNLWLIGTSVTPAGASKLQKKLPKTKIAY